MFIPIWFHAITSQINKTRHTSTLDKVKFNHIQLNHLQVQALMFQSIYFRIIWLVSCILHITRKIPLYSCLTNCSEKVWNMQVFRFFPRQNCFWTMYKKSSHASAQLLTVHKRNASLDQVKIVLYKRNIYMIM